MGQNEDLGITFRRRFNQCHHYSRVGLVMGPLRLDDSKHGTHPPLHHIRMVAEEATPCSAR